MHDHQVQFYEQDVFLLDGLCDFIGGGMAAGQAGIVIATEAHRDDLAQRLRARGASLDAALRSGRYVALDAAETLAKFMVDGWPDKRLFTEAVTDLLRRAGQNGRQVTAFGEMVALLWAEGKHKAAIHLEELWDDLVQAESISLLCAYPLQGFSREEHAPFFQHICSTHTRVHLAERYVDTVSPERSTSRNLTHLASSREIMARKAARMTRHVEELLDISRITRGKIALRSAKVLLCAIVNRSVELVRPLIEERGHRLTLDLPDEPVFLFGDTARLVQIVSNLLHHAAKFTEPGGNIYLRARQDGSDLLLAIRDDGVGLSAELCEQAFDHFAHEWEALEGGIGIGLTLVRILVDLHGGSIEAFRDGEGPGNEFVIRLPQRQPGSVASPE